LNLRLYFECFCNGYHFFLYPLCALCSKSMYVYTEQQESSVLATINLENEKYSKKCRVIIIVFLLLNVCTYVHHCDLTPTAVDAICWWQKQTKVSKSWTTNISITLCIKGVVYNEFFLHRQIRFWLLYLKIDYFQRCLEITPSWMTK